MAIKSLDPSQRLNFKMADSSSGSRRTSASQLTVRDGFQSAKKAPMASITPNIDGSFGSNIAMSATAPSMPTSATGAMGKGDQTFNDAQAKDMKEALERFVEEGYDEGAAGMALAKLASSWGVDKSVVDSLIESTKKEGKNKDVTLVATANVMLRILENCVKRMKGEDLPREVKEQKEKDKAEMGFAAELA